MIEFCLLDLVIVIVAKIFCILFHLPFPSGLLFHIVPKRPGGGGLLLGILGVGVPLRYPNPNR